MSKSTKHVADETFSIQLSKQEWNDMYDKNNNTFENYHGLLHQRLYDLAGHILRPYLGLKRLNFTRDSISHFKRRDFKYFS